jgi:ComF family protein
MNIREILRYFTGIFYPEICDICHQNLMIGESVICLSCLCQIPRTNMHLRRENIIEERFMDKVKFERATAFFYYSTNKKYKKAIHSLKYHNNKEIGETIGKYAAAEFIESEDFKHFDYLVPVPLHPKKLRQRGYNQSFHIALGIAQILNCEIETENLVRTVETVTQTKKNAFERMKNTKDIFAVRDSQLFENKRILLIDDVITTGATLAGCIEAINKVCNAKVSIFGLAVA